MICFLTGSPMLPDRAELNPANRLAQELRRCVPNPCRALTLASDPAAYEKTELYAGITKNCLEKAGFRFTQYRILDNRNRFEAAALVREAELLILSGGHVPTQNRFFNRIGLRELLRSFDGVVLGISAGSMNAASTVYAQPEAEGEAVDPEYQKFLPGLGLTETMLLPHYQMVKDDVLDGLRLYEDITLPDSLGRRFYAIPDGSYLYVEPDREELRGEAYLVRDGRMRQILKDGETLRLR